ncbi:hypothetical protein ACLOJK_008889 [Asimina triloba]
MYPPVQSSAPRFNQPGPPHINTVDEKFMQLQQLILSQQQSLSKLESQIGQLAKASMRREVGQLPSQPISNPRNHPPVFQPPSGPLPPSNSQFENAKVISTLSGKVLPDPYPQPIGESLVEKSRQDPEDENTDQFQAKSHDEGPDIHEDPSKYQPKAPFPSALEVKPISNQKLTQNEEMLELFKQGRTCTRQRAPAAYAMEHLPCSIINMNGRQPWLPLELESLPPVIATNTARRNQQTPPVATTLLPPSVEARRRRTTPLKKKTKPRRRPSNPPCACRRCPDPSHSSRR